MRASKGPYLTPAEFQQTDQTTLGPVFNRLRCRWAAVQWGDREGGDGGCKVCTLWSLSGTSKEQKPPTERPAWKIKHFANKANMGLSSTPGTQHHSIPTIMGVLISKVSAWAFLKRADPDGCVRFNHSLCAWSYWWAAVFSSGVCFHTALLVFDAPGRIQRQESWSRSAIYLPACSVIHRHSSGIWENLLMFMMLISLLSCPCSPVIDFLWLKFGCIDPSVRQLALRFLVTVNICYFNTFPRLGHFFC